MRFNVAQILQEPTGATRWHRIQEASALLDDFQAKHLEGWLKFTRTDMGIWAQGRVTADVTVQCSRCLAHVEVALDREISEQFYPVVDTTTGTAIASLMLEEEAFRIDATNELDVREALRQNLITSLPMKPLCTQDCAGICSTCGVNRNESECHCREETLDPRWAQLQQLLPSAGSGGTERA